MTQKVKRYCTCGAAWAGSFPRGAAGFIESAFEEIHQGDGHQPCDAKTAARARERQERKQAREAHR